MTDVIIPVDTVVGVAPPLVTEGHVSHGHEEHGPSGILRKKK